MQAAYVVLNLFLQLDSQAKHNPCRLERLPAARQRSWKNHVGAIRFLKWRAKRIPAWASLGREETGGKDGITRGLPTHPIYSIGVRQSANEA
jgi:hypothetical protein